MRTLFVVLTAIMLASAGSAIAHHREGHSGGGGNENSGSNGNSGGNGHSDDSDSASNGTGKGKDQNKTTGRDADRSHPQNKTPQGKALGHDTEWKSCRDSAGGNSSAKSACHAAAMERAQVRHDAIRIAREAGKIGGSILIDGNGTFIDPLNGVAISVENQTLADNTSTIAVTFDASLDEGQTFVLDLDPSVFGTEDLTISYQTIGDDGNVTDVEIQEADSLKDVLNPDNDTGPEYWAVLDNEGYHILVSVDHWSVHSVVLSSEGSEHSTAAIPSPGVVSLVGLLGLAALAFKRRR